MTRQLDDLESSAEKFWPTALSQREQSTSIIPKLIKTHEKFIGLLYMSDASPTAWKAALKTTRSLPANLFLKHLIVLCDVGGEKLQRYRREIDNFFPSGTMTFHWHGSDHKYRFQSRMALSAFFALRAAVL